MPLRGCKHLAYTLLLTGVEKVIAAMRATRNFRLTRTQDVLAPPFMGQGLTRGVIAGEACTEIGCESPVRGGVSWFERWLGFGRKAVRTLERKSNGTQPRASS